MEKALNKQKLFSDSFAMMAANLFSAIVSFASVMILARYLGVSLYGKYAFAFAFVGIFVIFAKFGIDTLFVRNVARENGLSEKYFRNIFSLKLILSSAVGACIVIVISLTDKDLPTKIIVGIATISVLCDNFNLSIEALYQALQKISLKAMMLVLKNVCAIVFLAAFVVLKMDIYVVAAYLLITNFIYFAINLVFIKNKFFVPKPSFDLDFIKLTLRRSLPFFSKMMFIYLYARSDLIMLSFMRTDAEVGLYRAAYNFLFFVAFIPGSLATVIFPLISRLFHMNEKDKLRSLYNSSLEMLLFLAVPIAVFMFFLAPRIIVFVYSSSYLESANILKILTVAVPFIFLNYLYNNLLIGCDLQKQLAWFIAGSAILNVLLNLVLIPKFGYYGAAFSTILAEVSVFVMSLILISKHISIEKKTVLEIAKIVLSTVIVGFIAVRFVHINIFIFSSLAVIVYVIANSVLRTRAMKELRLFAINSLSGKVEDIAT
jgi:O-antigen/teichoic acid export membrane protein